MVKYKSLVKESGYMDNFTKFKRNARALGKQETPVEMSSLNYFYDTTKFLAKDTYLEEFGVFDTFYTKSVLRELLRLEDSMKGSILMPNLQTTLSEDINSSNKTTNTLNRLITMAEIKLHHGLIKDGLPDLTDRCEEASHYVKTACDLLNLKCLVLKIEAGFERDSNLLGKNGFHYFNIVIINDRRFLVDLTYSQFFKQKNNHIERLGVPLLVGPSVGAYMVYNPERKIVASNLLKNRWIEATDENLKHYFDGFALSYRNGLFYENQNVRDFSTPYTTEDYFNFLDGKDSQIAHETEECLGYQLRPLKK